MNKIGYEQNYKELLVTLLHHGYINTKGYFKEEEDSFDHGNNADTIILTPGLTCTPSAVAYLGELLKEDHNVVYAPRSLSLNMGSVIYSAIELMEKMYKVKGEINLIGHSLGGIIEIEALRLATNIHVNNVIAMSSPFKGPDMAKVFSPIIPACLDISSEGGYHAHTDITDKIEGKLIAHVSMEDSIVPHKGQIPNAQIARGKTQILRFPNFEHHSFIMGDTAKRTADIINQYLGNSPKK